MSSIFAYSMPVTPSKSLPETFPLEHVPLGHGRTVSIRGLSKKRADAYVKLNVDVDKLPEVSYTPASGTDREPDARFATTDVGLAKCLADRGYVVVPIMSPDQVRAYLAQLDSSLRENVDLLAPSGLAGITKENPAVLGSFACLANPSSVHCWPNRMLRCTMYDVVAPIIATYGALFTDVPLESLYVRAVMDRLMIRPRGVKYVGESAHRDSSPTSRMEATFGSFVNLNSDPSAVQYFRCYPGTHTNSFRDRLNGTWAGHVSDDSGFVREASAARLPPVDVRVPVGHAVVFFSDLLHEVYSKVEKSQLVRLFMGYCLSPYNIHPYEERVHFELDSFLMPFLPSGPPANAFSMLHFVSHKKGETPGQSIVKFFTSRGHPDLFLVRDPGTDKYLHREMYYPSLVFYRDHGYIDPAKFAELYPPYSSTERAVYGMRPAAHLLSSNKRKRADEGDGPDVKRAKQ